MSNLREPAAPAMIAGSFADYRLIKSRLDAMSIPEPNSGCWLWLGASRAYRYGSMRVGRGVFAAHRVSWTVYRGEIPDGLHVLHRCDTGFCINPYHLFLGTHLENMEDRERKGRGNQPSGLRNGRHTKPERTLRGDAHPARRIEGWGVGERNGRAKLTADDVRAIRGSPVGCRRLGKQYGVSKTTILGIRNRRLWGHIP